MFQIHVERTLSKDIDAVFEAISDHALSARRRSTYSARSFNPQ
ncbi:hypothetical protein [Marinobacter sp.]|nr:hypothetical protein [Marinobacter sp.]